MGVKLNKKILVELNLQELSRLIFALREAQTFLRLGYSPFEKVDANKYADQYEKIEKDLDKIGKPYFDRLGQYQKRLDEYKKRSWQRLFKSKK